MIIDQRSTLINGYRIPLYKYLLYTLSLHNALTHYIHTLVFIRADFGRQEYHH
jgi:uncharacterized membrane protein YcgQ (UPF0703/DUF1980 family)